MAKLRYRKGDATNPVEGGGRLICHVVNDQGFWGRGFTAVINKRFPQVEQKYRSLAEYSLGEIQPVFVDGRPGFVETYVVNMIAQHGIRRNPTGRPPIRYQALASCLDKVSELALHINEHAAESDYTTIVGPRFGAGLAGGDWAVIEPMVRRYLVDRGHNVAIYDPGK